MNDLNKLLKMRLFFFQPAAVFHNLDANIKTCLEYRD